ncbi:BatD family protein [Neptuniibacter sp. CAU 1671]|uniref:BatD family protein n=1 Tax=Neptuniibacter sp. CAU 1671 TaxID=3032593 RepID=UPI0023DB44FF|nr:BatD family protein [Neptuniibacter sp. CAU 1671]MDF2180449.1 BatD family protein [Neptuniibacter sp. CAU 1671]
MVILRVLWVCILLSLSGQTLASISSQVDRNVLEQGESFLLVLNMRQGDTSSVDLAPLEKDFEILGRSHKTTTNILNGDIQTHTRLILTLSPKRAGTLTVPPLTLNGDQTEPHEIVVSPLQLKSAVDGGVELLSRLSDEHPMVQQPIIYQLNLVLGQRIGNAVFQEPKITAGSASIKPLGEQRQHRQVINGNEVLVVEQAWLITPQQSGKLEIESAKLGADIIRATNPYGRFSDPRSLQRIHLAADSYSLDVKPIPAGFTGQQWLPAKSLSIKDELKSAEFKAGEPFTRIITVEATGISEEQLSALVLPDLPGVKQYAAKPVYQVQQQGSEIGVRMTQEVTLIPTRAGSVTLPEIRLPWWNVTADVQDEALLEAKTLEVLPGAVTSDAMSVPDPVQQAVDTTRPETSPSLSALPEQTNATPVPAKLTTHWLLIMLVSLLAGAGLGVLATLLILRNRKPVVGQTIAPVTEPSAAQKREVWKRFESACRSNQPQPARVALLQWLQLNNPALIHLNQYQSEVDAPLKQAIDELNRVCFTEVSEQWGGVSLLTLIKADSKQYKASTEGKRELSPLIPA